MARAQASKQFYFLIVYRLDKQVIDTILRFDDADEASTAYAQAEEQHRADDRYEVVLVGADSESTIRQTHSRYFWKEGKESPF